MIVFIYYTLLQDKPIIYSFNLCSVKTHFFFIFFFFIIFHALMDCVSIALRTTTKEN